MFKNIAELNFKPIKITNNIIFFIYMWYNLKCSYNKIPSNVILKIYIFNIILKGEIY